MQPQRSADVHPPVSYLRRIVLGVVRVVMLSVLLSGCFAELTAGPGFATGGAGGVGFSIGVVAGVNYDFGSTVRVGVAGEFRGNKTVANQETFVHNHRGLTLITDTALASDYDSRSLKTIRLRLGAGWAPSTTLSLTPALTGKTYHPPLVVPPGADTARDAVEQPHTTWSATGGLAWDVTEGPLGYALGVDFRVDHVPSQWMGNVTFLTPPARVALFVTADGLMHLMDGVSFSNVKVPPPPAWLKPLPKGPDTSHSDDDIKKSNTEIERQRQEDKKRCQGGGPCSN